MGRSICTLSWQRERSELDCWPSNPEREVSVGPLTRKLTAESSGPPLPCPTCSAVLKIQHDSVAFYAQVENIDGTLSVCDQGYQVRSVDETGIYEKDLIAQRPLGNSLEQDGQRRRSLCPRVLWELERPLKTSLGWHVWTWMWHKFSVNRNMCAPAVLSVSFTISVSPHLFQLFRRVLQLCVAGKLQKCLLDYKTSHPLWWTYPFNLSSLSWTPDSFLNI